MKAEQYRKKKRKQLLIRLLNPQDSDTKRGNIEEVQKRLIKIFRYHIGKENAISSFDLFVQVYDVSPETLSVFERSYLWEMIKIVLSQLRSSEILFVVNNIYKFYVLQSEEELEQYTKRVNHVIEGLETMKKKAKRWVANKQWKNL